MDKAIERASRADATASFVTKPVISENTKSTSYTSSSHNILLSDPTNSALYFSALLSNPSLLVGGRYCGGIVGLLLLVTPQFQSSTQKCTDETYMVPVVTEEQARLYLRAAAVHVDAILEEWNCGNISNRNVEDISKALGFAAKICSQQNRSLISSSGILPALAKLITGYQSHRAFLLSNASNAKISSNSTTATTKQAQDNTEPTMARNFLTPVHAEFLRIAILAGHYRLASTFVQRHPVHTVDQHSWSYESTTPHDSRTTTANKKRTSNINTKRSSSSSFPKPKPLLSSESFLRYFYYLGMIHLGCDDYNAALSVFDICLKVPANIISAIVIAARKKMILARCLALALDDEEEYLSYSSSSNSKNKSTGGRGRDGGIGGGGGGGDGMKKIFCPLTRTIMELPRGVSPQVTECLERAERLSNDHDAGNQDGTSAISLIYSGNSGGVDASSKSNKNNEPVSSSSSHGMPYYHLLVSSFAKCDIPTLLNLIQIGGAVTEPSSTTTTINIIGYETGILKRDGNMGLAQRLVPAIKHRLVRKLGRIYEAVSLDTCNKKLGVLGNVAARAPGSNSLLAEDWLMHLAIKKTEESCPLSSSSHSSSFQTPFLEFAIDMQDSVVHFFQDGHEDDGHDDNGNETKSDSGVFAHVDEFARNNAQAKLANRIATCMDLAERVTHLDVKLATSMKYQTKIMKDGGGGNGGGGGEDGAGDANAGGPRSVMDYYK